MKANSHVRCMTLAIMNTIMTQKINILKKKINIFAQLKKCPFIKCTF